MKIARQHARRREIGSRALLSGRTRWRDLAFVGWRTPVLKQMPAREAETMHAVHGVTKDEIDRLTGQQSDLGITTDGLTNTTSGAGRLSNKSRIDAT